MKTNRLLEKAYDKAYSMRMNGYVEDRETLLTIYAKEIKSYCEKKGWIISFEEAYTYADSQLAFADSQAA